MLGELAYPCGRAPGYNPSHIAAALTAPSGMLSAVAFGSNMVEITTGATGAVVGAPTGGLDGVMGPVVKGTSTTGWHFANKPTVIPNGITMAGIWSTTTIVPTNQMLVGNSLSGTGGVEINVKSGVFFVNTNGGVNTSSGLAAIQTNTPYFMACTINGATTVAFVQVNLATGQTVSSSVAGHAISSPGSGTWTVGDTPSGTNGVQGSIAAAMVTPTYIGLQGLLLWAADPWSLWYPK